MICSSLVSLGGMGAQGGVFAEQAVAFGAAGDGVEEFFRGERFGQVVNGAGFDGLHRQLGGGVGGDHEEGDVGPAFAGLGQEFVAAHLAQAGVGDDHEEFQFLQGGERLFGGFGHLDVIALPVQDGLEGKAHVLFVVNDQDGRKGQAHGFNLIKMRDGNSRVKRVPFPGSDWTLTAPPYISVLCLTIARPRPVPLARVVK